MKQERERCNFYVGCGECGFDEQTYTPCYLGSHFKQCNLYEEKKRCVGYPADMDMTQDEIMRTEYRLNMPKPIGRLIHEPTHHTLAVYKPISRFKRLMLRWAFGLKFEKI